MCEQNKFFVLFFLLSFLSGLNSKSFGEKISKDVLEKLARVKSMSDFIRVFKIKDEFKGTDNETLSDEDEEPTCDPRPTIIEIGQGMPGHYLYYPACMFANRCGGCCQPTVLRKCVSTENETLYKDVWRISPDGGYSKIKFPYTSHKTCGCACIAKPSDCVGKQVFDKDNCRCECNVKEEEKQCPEEKQWSDIYCDCVCKRQDCPDGKKLNKVTCQCEPIEDENSSKNVIEDDNPR